MHKTLDNRIHKARVAQIAQSYRFCVKKKPKKLNRANKKQAESKTSGERGQGAGNAVHTLEPKLPHLRSQQPAAKAISHLAGDLT
jgi:hypothetical protein